MSTTETITRSETFDTAGQYQLDIPEAARNIYVELEGAGGDGSNGGLATGYLPRSVAAGGTLDIFVGGGGDGTSGGFNGGGSGGSTSDGSANGGGGASDIRIGGTTLADRVVVAGGGGGDDYSNTDGADGGGLQGDSSSGAGGGTQNEGGEGDADGEDGEFGDGGDGGDDNQFPGGGGGGGWYGGGGGSSGSSGNATGGGGGSSYIDELEDGGTETGEGSSSGSDGSVTVEYEVDPEPVEDFAVADERHTEIDLEWTAVDDDADGQRLYRSLNPGVDPDESTLLEDLDANTESYTDEDLNNGTSYYYLLETYLQYDGEEAVTPSGEVGGQTTLPGIDDFELDASVQDEITVTEIVSELNTGQYRARWKRSDENEFDDEDEVIIPFDSDPLEYTISPVLDGQKFDVGVRSESEEIESDWFTVSEITKLVPVSGIEFDSIDDTPHNYDSDLDISWTVESDYEGGQELYRYETTDTDSDGNLGELIESLDIGTEQYVDSADVFRVGRDYVYTIRTETEYVHADATATFEASRAGLQAALYLEVDRPDRDSFTIDPPKAIQSATIRHSATSNVDIATQDLGPELRTLAQANPDVDLRTRLIDSTGQEVRDNRIIKGVLGEVETQGESDEATLKTKGRGWYLENGTPDAPFHAENIQVWEAIVDYAEQHLSDWDVEVIPDPGQPVATDEVAQSPETQQEWLDLLEEQLGDTDPFETDNGQFLQTRCSWAYDPPDPLDPPGSASFAFDSEYSDGRGVEFESAGEYMDYTHEIFQVDHTIPANEVGVAVRFDVSYAGSDETNATVELQLRDADTDSKIDSITIYEGSPGTGVFWRGFGSDDFFTGLPSGVDSWPTDIEPGSYYFRLECTESPSVDGNAVIVDMPALFDSRFNYNWDDNVHEDDGYLDGPEPFPTVSFELPVEERETNIDAARIESLWNDTSGEQAIALSNDNGDNWLEQSNTDSLDVNFAENQLFGTRLRARFTFSGHPESSEPQEETPRFRYNPQSVDSYELRFDQSSVAVINDSIFSDSHKENLNTLVERGRMFWVIDHTADGKALKVFPIGTENGGVGWTTKDWSRSDGSFQYANRVVARGARKPEEERENEDDLRYEGEVTDDDEIQQRLDDGLPADKATVTRTILDPELETQEEVNQQAFNALEDYVEARLASGSVDVVPTFIPPGYAYPVPEFEDENGETPTKVLQQVSLSMGYDSATGTLQFEEPQNWVTAVNPIEGDVGGLKRLF